MNDHPVYVMSDPKEYADNFKGRLLDIGCDEKFAEAARKDVLKRAVQVGSGFEANALASGRRHQ